MVHPPIQLIVLAYCLCLCRAFAPRMSRRWWGANSWGRPDPHITAQQKFAPSKTGLGQTSSALSDLSDERKNALFQYMLRDFQVEGVPLLAVDVDQVHTLQVAMWTTMAELSEQSSGERACMIFEDIPVDTLRSFVDGFMEMKQQERLIQSVPELGRFNLSMVGKGVGPAILVETGNTTETSLGSSTVVQSVEDGFKYQAAMKAFVARMVAKTDPFPYQEDYPLLYKTCSFSEICHILSSFWNCICELSASPDKDLGSIMLTLPNMELCTGDRDDSELRRFGAVSELLSRSLCLYQGDEKFEIYHFHPTYGRDKIFPKDSHAHGHIPPKGWLKTLVSQSGKNARDLTSEDIAAYDYQRRSPIPAVWIKRVALLADGDSINDDVKLDLEGGTQVLASKIGPYSQTTLTLGDQGESRLKEELDSELAILR